MKKIALVTCVEQPTLTADDELLASALVEAGFAWQAVPWSDDGVDWLQFDGIVLRSTWDYHLRLDAFLGWVASLEAAGAPVWNSPATIRWNAHKQYLRDLKAAGIAVVPTEWIAEGSTVDLARVLATRGWNEAVIKPAVSATAHGIVRASAADAARHDTTLTHAAANCDLLVQPFMPEIAQGEISLMFVDGTFSHAVRKRPKAGEFRVQSKFGGSVDRIEPPVAMVDQARAAISLAADPLYARVDGLDVDGHFVVMELELIEPELFLHTAPDASAGFVAGIARRIAAR